LEEIQYTTNYILKKKKKIYIYKRYVVIWYLLSLTVVKEQ